MGMFDSVIAECPKCGKKLEFQSKAGSCNLVQYPSYSVPAEIAIDLLGEFGDTSYCCGTEWKLTTTVPANVPMQTEAMDEVEEE